MKVKLSVLQLITYIILGMTLVFSILTMLTLKYNARLSEPDHDLDIMFLTERMDITPEQQKVINKCFDGIDEIQKQFPSRVDEEKKLKKMTKLFKKGKITAEELEKFKKEKKERLFKQNALYHQKYTDALNVITEKQFDESTTRMRLWLYKIDEKK